MDICKYILCKYQKRDYVMNLKTKDSIDMTHIKILVNPSENAQIKRKAGSSLNFSFCPKKLRIIHANYVKLFH